MFFIFGLLCTIVAKTSALTARYHTNTKHQTPISTIAYVLIDAFKELNLNTNISAITSFFSSLLLFFSTGHHLLSRPSHLAGRRTLHGPPSLLLIPLPRPPPSKKTCRILKISKHMNIILWYILPTYSTLLLCYSSFCCFCCIELRCALSS